MKIIYTAASPVPSKAANSVHVMRMSQALAHNGHKVLLVTPGHSKAEDFETKDLYKLYGVENIFKIKRTFSVPFQRLKYRCHGVSFALMAFRFRPDLIYSRCLFTASLSLKLGFKVIFERHDLLNKKSAEKRFNFLKDHPNCLGIVVISQSLKEAMLKNYYVNPEKLIVSHDGADPIPEITTPKIPADDRLKAGYIGHLYEGRGIDIIGETARLLPDIDFHLVGGMPEDIAKWKSKFQDIKNIIFHGHVMPSETATYMISFDVLLAPYQKKVAVHGNAGDTAKFMSPLKIFEYMSSGKPIICSDLPVLHEVLKNGSNVLFCQHNLPEEWARNISFIKMNKEEASKIGATAKKDFFQYYTWRARARFILNEALDRSDR